MKKPERFAYHGNASLVSGRLQRPRKAWLEVGGASTLPANGGLSSATVRKHRFGDVLGFQSGSTHAEGGAHVHTGKGRGRSAYRELTLHERAAHHDHTSHAHTGAEMTRLFVDSGRVRLTAKSLRAELTALCSCDEKQPSIGALDRASFDGIAFGRYALEVTVNRAFFRDHDTHAKLCAVCTGSARAKAPRAVLAAPRARSASGDSAVLTTIVKSLRWEGRPYPGATIDRHSVSIPGFGRVFFGEMIVKSATRRLTMLRLELDGAVALHGACCEVEAGGTWVR